MEDKALIHVELIRKGEKDNISVRFEGEMNDLFICLASVFLDMESEYIESKEGNRERFARHLFGVYGVIKSQMTTYDKKATRTHMDGETFNNIRKIIKEGENND